MKVAIHLQKKPVPAGPGHGVVIDGVDLETALALSAALQDLHPPDLDALILIGAPPRRPPHASIRRGLDWLARQAHGVGLRV